MKQIKRKYPTKDAYMLNFSAALQTIFVENLADFTTFDNSLDLNFANQWLVQINEAFLFAQNSQLKDIQKQNTDKVSQLLKECKVKYHEVQFFAYKAFEPNDKHRAIFGKQSFTKVKRNASAMIAFMDTLYSVCIEHQAALTANSMSMADIEEIATLRDQLTVGYTESQNYQKVKRSLTYERIQVLNKCYAMTRLVIKAAFIIYREDYARKKMFVFDAVKR